MCYLASRSVLLADRGDEPVPESIGGTDHAGATHGLLRNIGVSSVTNAHTQDGSVRAC